MFNGEDEKSAKGGEFGAATMPVSSVASELDKWKADFGKEERAYPYAGSSLDTDSLEELRDRLTFAPISMNIL